MSGRAYCRSVRRLVAAREWGREGCDRDADARGWTNQRSPDV